MVATRQISTNVISPWQSDALGYVAANWYLGTLPIITIAGLSSSVTQQIMIPFVVRQTITVQALGIRITTPGTTNIQLGIYASDAGATLNRPGALLANTGNIPNTGAPGFYSAALLANVQLTPGIYWLAYQCNDTTCLVMSASASSTSFQVFVGSTTGANVIGPAAAEMVSLSIPSTFGTWLTAVGAVFTEQTTSRATLIAFQVLSSP